MLLHLLAGLKRLKPALVAVYVNHGLHPEAVRWAEHCRKTAAGLGVPFIGLAVDARPKPGQSPEEAARGARYQALQALLKAGDALLLGQHQDDQMETVLLQLARGAGIQGLSAMPECANLGAGLMLRPLLTVSKAAINAYAIRHRLDWIEDPSNLHENLDRNFLRRSVMPVWRQRWPQLAETVARAARHCAEAHMLLDEWLEEAINPYFDSDAGTLRIPAPGALSQIRLKALIRKWLQLLGLKPPSEAVLINILHEVVNARPDGAPEIIHQNHRLTRYRDKLYCLPLPVKTTGFNLEWPRLSNVLTIPHNGRLWLTAAGSGIDGRLWRQAKVTVKSRAGGETITLSSCRRTLKKLFQEAGIPPWERELRPLVYLDGKLAAVAGLGIDRWAFAESGDCYRIKWRSGVF